MEPTLYTHLENRHQQLPRTVCTFTGELLIYNQRNGLAEVEG